jgi:membrane-bound ClpP family serine protease
MRRVYKVVSLFCIMDGIDKFSMTAGIVLTVVGFILSIIGTVVHWSILIYGLGSLIIGIIILATLRQQEYIEPIREKVKRIKK